MVGQLYILSGHTHMCLKGKLVAQSHSINLDEDYTEQSIQLKFYG